jgi:hypothetical protein
MQMFLTPGRELTRCDRVHSTDCAILSLSDHHVVRSFAHVPRTRGLSRSQWPIDKAS